MKKILKWIQKHGGNFLNVSALFGLSILSFFARLFLPRRKRRYYKEKMKKRHTPLTRANAINKLTGKNDFIAYQKREKYLSKKKRESFNVN